MKLYKCQACAQLLFFENTKCEKCFRQLGYLADADLLTPLEAAGDAWMLYGKRNDKYRLCRNTEYGCCNWLIPAGSADTLCTACRHNGTIPDLSLGSNVALWRKMEFAKHRLFYTLLRLKLPLETRAEDPNGLIFDFLTDTEAASGPKVMTGHDNGRITIALVEADDSERERRRLAMGEPYRTLLGHFRHEIGHYYWDRLVRDAGRLQECRAVFGDDSLDYDAALRTYYEKGAPPDWQENFVSAYATSHAWEDFAETWAHYLHIVDTLEMAHAFGLNVEPRLDRTGDLAAHIDVSPFRAQGIEQLIEAWLPLTFALNSINRCMGQADLYPFVLTPGIIDKLGFIHRLTHGLVAPDRAEAPALVSA